MSDPKKDDVAAALAALAGGQVPSEHETPSGGIPSESTVFSPPKPTPPPTTPPAPPAAASVAQSGPVKSNRPSIPDSTRNVAAPPTVPPPFVPPVARIRPAGPPSAGRADSSAPPPRQRPSAPQRAAAPQPAPVPAPEPEAPPVDDSMLAHIVEDDQMDAPAADISTFARTPAPKKKKKAGSPLYANLKFRQTLIPLLLTNGVLLPGIGAWVLLSKTSPLHDVGPLLPIMLVVIGVVLLLAGLLNAFHIKHLLQANA